VSVPTATSCHYPAKGDNYLQGPIWIRSSLIYWIFRPKLVSKMPRRAPWHDKEDANRMRMKQQRKYIRFVVTPRFCPRGSPHFCCPRLSNSTFFVHDCQTANNSNQKPIEEEDNDGKHLHLHSSQFHNTVVLTSSFVCCAVASS
jgi:hypothetical protein